MAAQVLYESPSHWCHNYEVSAGPSHCIIPECIIVEFAKLFQENKCQDCVRSKTSIVGSEAFP